MLPRPLPHPPMCRTLSRSPDGDRPPARAGAHRWSHERGARLIAALGVALAATACSRQTPPTPEVAPRPVRTVVAAAQPVSGALVLPGEVRPRIESRLGFRVGGKLAERLVNPGDRVVPGQLLARLDPQDVAPAIAAQQAQVAAARTDLRLAQADLARIRDLRERDFVSQAQLDRQQAGVDAAAARLEVADAQLRQVRTSAEFQALRADSAGVVTAIDAEPGQVVAAGQSVLRVARTAEKEVLVNVPEPSVALARRTAQWQVSVPALGRTVPARMREIGPVSDPASRTYPMRLVLSGALEGIELGMTATVAAAGETAQAIVLPASALTSRDGRPQVWVVDPASATVRPVPVRPQALLDDAVRIAEGLRGGERVVVAGANLLVDGQKVRLLEPAAR